MDGRARELLPALERATRFLLDRQGADGFWRDFTTPAGPASAWPTGFIAAALHRAGADPVALDRAAAALLASQHPDGGWGYHEHVPTDADSTAWALLFLGSEGRHGAACWRAAEALVDRQHAESGGIATYADAAPIREFMGVGRWMRFRGWCRPHPDVTAVAGAALAASHPGAAAAAWRFVRAGQRPDGSWPSYWWTSPLYGTAQAVVLARRFGDDAALDRAAGWLLARRPGGQGPPGAFAAALSLSILLEARVGGPPLDEALGELLALQADDGGWPSAPIMRVPLPGDVDPDRWRPVRLGTGLVVADQHRTFTSAACIAALTVAHEVMD
jgi:hypothetical protein